MNDEERRNVSIPESVTINGITYVVRDTPELQKFMQAVSKVEKNKLYSQFESLKNQLEDLRKVQVVPDSQGSGAGVNVKEIVEALLRRSDSTQGKEISIGNTTLCYESLQINDKNEKIFLPQKEFYLLYKLISSIGKIFTKQQLFDEIWGFDSETDIHTIDVHIARIRERFKDNTDFSIVTIRGLG